MPAFATLIDNFNDNTIGPEWGNAYGGVSETGGRARIPCTTGYAGYQTGGAWTLTGSSVYLQLPVTPAASTATEAYVAAYALSATAGTRIGFAVDAVAGMLRMQSQTGYYDPAAVSIAYNPTTHLWLRLAETGGTISWDTSPDGTTWTNRRTLATPAWITAAVGTLALDIFCHRNAGTADYAEIDNVNTLSDGAVHDLSGTANFTLTATGNLQRTAILTGHASCALTATAALNITANLTGSAHIALTASGDLDGADESDPTVSLAGPRLGWQVTGPWI